MPAEAWLALAGVPRTPCALASVCGLVMSSLLLAYDTWCHAVLIAPRPGASSMWGYVSRVASSAAVYTTVKSASYSECLAVSTSFLWVVQPVAHVIAARKMIRCRRMGSRTRNSTPKQPPRARNADPGPAAPGRIAAISAQLATLWPDAVVELDHENAYQLLVATILAAQSPDKLINTG